MKPARKTETTRLPSSTKRRLVRALARRCRGRTRVLGRPEPWIERELRKRGVELPAQRDTRYETVLMLGCLEQHDASEHATIVERAWSTLAGDGRLIVCVPHDDGLEPPVESRFDRRRLKRLLQRIDRPQLIKDVPYRWLAMYIDGVPRLDRASVERQRVIAGFCRGRVLELGCGYGHLCDAIARRGLEVEGIDISKTKIRRAAELFPGLEFRRADILDLRADVRYDSVVLAEVLEHVPRETGQRMLDRAWSLVDGGGRLIVSVPNEDCVPHANHVREFRVDDLVRELARFGKPRVIDEQPFKWLLAVLERRPRARMTAS